MAFKSIVLFASALLVQSISGQYLNRIASSNCGCSSGNILSSENIFSSGNLLSSGLSYSGVSNNGGAFNVQSLGPIVPGGIVTATDLNLAADLAIAGTLPWLSAVEFCGELPTSGSGSVAYGCGDGNIAITQELGNPGGNNAASSAGLGLNSLGLNSCGCGRRF